MADPTIDTPPPSHPLESSGAGSGEPEQHSPKMSSVSTVFSKQEVDYSLYLVTDSTPAILRDRDICAVVEAALRGGVTCVQYRDKTSDTGRLIEVAKRLHAITKRYGRPLLINDRVDVALAVGCEGVHVGQED